MLTGVDRNSQLPEDGEILLELAVSERMGDLGKNLMGKI